MIPTATLAGLGVVLILSLIALSLLWRRAARAQSRADALASALAGTEASLEHVRSVAANQTAVATEAQARIRELQARVAELANYQVVGDAQVAAAEIHRRAQETAAEAAGSVAALRMAADADAARVRQDAQIAADALRADAFRRRDEAQRLAQDLMTQATEEAKALRAQAVERAEQAGMQAEASLQAARSRADEIIAEARTKGEAIAGDALRALEQAHELERTVAALRNTVDGYGDQYLIPSHTLIDDLAEDFGHTEAGQRLKVIRDQIRQTVKQGAAATCDYVEPNRRETAVRFVIDAFNGKADSVLAKVRHDNAGTLQQELRDGYTLVNHHGQAFRNARITEEYLNLRLAELRWASVTHELRLQEREEQRRVKEQLREEEKARKEYERAIREAARDEDLLRKAMDKAEEKLGRANAEQRVKFEAQLRELQAKLAEAEERNQRALSMAQQTKRGHVYIISNMGSLGENVYKIGLTRRLEPLDRIRELGDSSVPFEFDVHALIFAEDAPALEYQLHRHFVMNQINKVNYRKEFFRVDLAHIRREIEKLGLTAAWTMTAAATEFRESQAIERLVAENPAAREAWLRRQLTYEARVDVADEDIDVMEARPVIDPATPRVAVDALLAASPASVPAPGLVNAPRAS
jgi:Meiotically Up-regulated Gene 113 (MUG113) protein/uncharacterized protein DUF4041